MATIYTDSFVNTDCDIEIGEPVIGSKGRELIITADEQEVRVELTDEQLEVLADLLVMNGFVQCVLEQGDIDKEFTESGVANGGDSATER